MPCLDRSPGNSRLASEAGFRMSTCVLSPLWTSYHFNPRTQRTHVLPKNSFRCGEKSGNPITLCRTRGNCPQCHPSIHADTIHASPTRWLYGLCNHRFRPWAMQYMLQVLLTPFIQLSEAKDLEKAMILLFPQSKTNKKENLQKRKIKKNTHTKKTQKPRCIHWQNRFSCVREPGIRK